MPQQKRATSPRSSTGSRSGLGSRPTTSWLRLRSTSVARRSPKVSVATAIPVPQVSGPKRQRAAGGGPLNSVRRSSALERGLELAPGAELRHGGGRDLDALAGARVDALAGGAVGGRELAEAREVDRIAALQGLRHGLHEGVDGLTGV